MHHPTRLPIIAGNWKMYKTPREAIDFVRTLIPLLEPLSAAERVICPPFIAISGVAEALAGTSIKVGAQNVHTQTAGAFTGNISAPMLQGLVDYVIVGHSEVRQYLGDTDAQINQKVKAILAHGMKPIVAVGESLAQHEAGEAAAFVHSQLRGALADLPAESIAEMVIAYEPLWAIGTGRNATGELANTIIGGIRHTVAAMYGDDAAQAIRIQYGGSVKPGNMAEFMMQPEIDGALVGGASLNADDFAALVRIAIESKQHDGR